MASGRLLCHAGLRVKLITDPSLRRVMLSHHASLGFRAAYDQVMAIWRCVKNGDALPKLASAGGKATYKSMSRLGWSPSAAGWSWHNDVVNVSLDVNQAGFVHVADKLAHRFVSLGGVACFAHARRMANHTAFAVWVVLLTPGPVGVALMKIDLALFAMLHWHWTLGITWLGLVRSTFLQGVSLSAACRLGLDGVIRSFLTIWLRPD